MDHPSSDLTTIGILGAGRVGTTIARQAMRAGLGVQIAASRPASELGLLVDIMTPGAIAVDASRIAEGADLVILAIPLGKYRQLPTDALAGAIVIDAMNYWVPTDGHLPEFADPDVASSEVIQRHLSASPVVKTLNHIGYHDLEVDHRDAGAPDRRALVVASDHAPAAARVGCLIDRLGYDPLVVESLHASRVLQPDTEIFNGRFTRPDLETILQRDGIIPSRVLAS